MTADKKGPYTPIPQEDAPPSYEQSHASPPASTSFRRVEQQPISTPQMTIAGARNPKSLEIGLDGKREWNHSLLGCAERPGLTAAACFCPCMVYSSNHHRLTSLTSTGAPTDSPRPVSLWCGVYALAPQLFGVGQVFMQCFSRYQTRMRYGIRGNEVQDVVIAALCSPCSLVQESREIEEEEEALRAEGGGIASPEVFYRDEEEQIVGQDVPLTESTAPVVTKKQTPRV
ncbi:PLAC8 family protein [Sporobolomyces salmoneus]|uniref:PLAC8 family protein n=1 Tax=Sporobolomyces salmoneus TaxID=183962 RepID=UPI003178BEF0